MEFGYCPIRKEKVQLLPEERVRLSCIAFLIRDLHFPKELLSVECALSSLPHLASRGDLPDCRIDLVCFARNIHPVYSLYPLLLVECKAVPLTEKAERQLAGYNFYVNAPFIALAGPNEMRLASAANPALFRKGMADYPTLLKAVIPAEVSGGRLDEGIR
ncbi:MAG: type I restriction enzyme HsdR N-terminal domain-containing protein [Chlamydiia bacterium]|nr:type I restriction enzyme HsdR N-terminal domain-containing protein [Chlamydiia bacterium]